MKILYHHRTASRDGQAVHIDEMIGAMRALGHEVKVVAPETPTADGAMGNDSAWVNALKGALPKSLYELLEIAYSAIAYRNLRRVADQFHPDFIYERYNLNLLAGIVLKKRLRVPLLLEVNAPLAEERGKHGGGLGLPWLARRTEQYVWRNAEFVLPVTQALASHIAKAGVAPEQIRVIPNGINRDHFSSAPSTDEAKRNLGLAGALVLGFTGFVREWHGVDRVIRWMASADAPPTACLMIVGDGPVRRELQELAERLGMGERVRFTGVIDRERVPEHVAAFDVALQPAVVSYASPLKLFEYLALAKCVVAPRQPNIQEILTHDENALLFDPDRPGDLEGALTLACADAERRNRLAQAAAATVERLDLTWLGNARKVTDLARTVIGR